MFGLFTRFFISVLLVAGAGWWIFANLLTTSIAERARAVETPEASAPGSFSLTEARTVAIAIGAGLVGLGAVIIVTRTRSRRRREYARYRIEVPRTDSPSTHEVAELIESWHRSIQRETWIGRLFLGQSHIGLELHSLPVAGGHEVVVSVVCEPTIAVDLDARLSACYPGARLGYPFQGPPRPWETAIAWTRHMIRLHKTGPGIFRAASSDERVVSVAEAALAAASGREAPVTIQLRLSPTPRLVERYERARLRGAERRLSATPSGKPGLSGSPLSRREIDGATERQHRAIFFGELWVASSSDHAARAVAGTLQAAGGENALGRRRPWSPIHRRRMPRAQPGFFSPSRFGAIEVATLWSIPGPASTVSVERAAVPRLPVPPAVLRADGEDAIGLTNAGGISLRPEERRLGVAFIGVQGSGKTSAMARLVRASAIAGESAIVVVDMKGDLAEAAISMIPADRPVFYLDFARPEFGINPLLAQAPIEAIADAWVGALRDVHEDGAIQASSDRFLRYAVHGAAVLAKDLGVSPTLWMVAALCDPGSIELWERVTELTQGDPDFANLATFYGGALREQLRNARSPTTAKLDAPQNKMQRFLGQVADRVLHHPVQLSIDSVIESRAILIVNGSMGSVGADTASKLAQILVRLVYAALQRQQERPEEERRRVELVIDEAHFVLNATFAKLLATGRSAGVEVVAGWQMSEQFQDPEVRGAIEALLHHRFVFRCGLVDARAASSLLMSTYSDVIRSDSDERRVQKVLPDTLLNLPAFHAVASVVAGGRRSAPFVIQTIPWNADRSALDKRIERQRGFRLSGGRPHFPPVIQNGLRELMDIRSTDDALSGESRTDTPKTTSAAPHRGEAVEVPAGDPPPGPPEVDAPAAAPGSGDVVASPEEAPVLEAVSPAPVIPTAIGAPTSYVELQMDDVVSFSWEKESEAETRPRKAGREPNPREFQVLRLVYRSNCLMGQQIRRSCDIGEERTAQRALSAMVDAGWLRRGRFRIDGPGATPYVYGLTVAGFKAAVDMAQRHGVAPPEGRWSEPAQRNAAYVLHDLHAAGWVLALESMLTKGAMRGWHGPRSARAKVEVPFTPGRDRRPAGVGDMELPWGSMLTNVPAFRAINADAVIELEVVAGVEKKRVDLFVECERSRNSSNGKGKLANYDAFITGWCRSLSRYQSLNERPGVVFVCLDEEHAMALATHADMRVTGAISTPHHRPHEWRYPGRALMYFVTEIDAHRGSLRAWKLPPYPPAVRASLGESRKPELREVSLIPRASPWRGAESG